MEVNIPPVHAPIRRFFITWNLRDMEPDEDGNGIVPTTETVAEDSLSILYQKGKVLFENIQQQLNADWMVGALECVERLHFHFAGRLKGNMKFQNILRKLKTAAELSELEGILSSSPWLEKLMGDFPQAREYCIPSDAVKKNAKGNLINWEYGEMPQQGKRTDVQVAMNYAKQQFNDEGSMLAAAEEDGNLDQVVGYLAKHPNAIPRAMEAYANLSRHKRKRDEEAAGVSPLTKDPLVVWLHGEPGIGKTTWARQQAEAAGTGWVELAHCDLRDMDHRQGWYNSVWAPQGCTGNEKILICDDICPGASPSLMRTLTSAGPVHVPVKNGGRTFYFDVVIITSNCSPYSCFPGYSQAGTPEKAFMSRVTDVVHYRGTHDRRDERNDITVDSLEHYSFHIPRPDVPRSPQPAQDPPEEGQSTQPDGSEENPIVLE